MPLCFRFLPFLTALAVAPAAVSSCPAVSSGTPAVTVLELYTSEGCDSCPPADRWFSTLSFRKDGVVPLAFHVDYWDYIGWKDRFGQAAFAARQRAVVARQGGHTVYTPQLMLDGRDARGLTQGSQLAEGVREAARRPARAALQLQSAAQGDVLEIAVRAGVDEALLRRESALFLAITENNLQSRVSAGENRGADLRHDHVVRELFGPIALRADGPLDIRRRLPLPRDWKRADLEVAAFVQDGRSGEVLQALAAPVCLDARIP